MAEYGNRVLLRDYGPDDLPASEWPDDAKRLVDADIARAAAQHGFDPALPQRLVFRFDQPFMYRTRFIWGWYYDDGKDAT